MEQHEVGRYLMAAQLGLSFVRPCPSKVSSSPTKIGEYLAAGLPVISTAGIGDVDELLTGSNVGVLVRSFTQESYTAAAQAATELSDDPETRDRCREVAREQLALDAVGVERYDRLYRAVAGIR